MKAIKAKYDRTTKTYGVEVIDDANPLHSHGGYLVYDDAAKVVEQIEARRLLNHWKPEHRAAVLTHLKAEAAVLTHLKEFAARQMPTTAEFDAAAKKLTDAGFIHYHTVMVDDAKKDGVTDFGRYYVRENSVTTDKFWLNYKTINQLPV